MKNKNLQTKWMVVTVLMTLLLGAVGMTKANPVDKKTANKAAQSFLNAKIGSCPKIDLIDFTEKASFSNFYVFGNEHCFVIIAADDCVHPVLGYSTENAFGIEEMPENVYGWLKAYNEDVVLAVNSKMEATDDIREEWNKLLNGQGLTPKTRTSVAPLVKTKWNQTAPYNNLCPEDHANDSSWYNGRTPTGCMATAMAQVLNYWEHPVRGVGEHSYVPQKHPEYGEQYANFGETVYDWDNMKNNYSNGYTDEEALAVATLMYHCGVSIDMNYTPTGSSGGYSTEPFKTYFNYNPDMFVVGKSYIMDGNVYNYYSNEEWGSMLKVELNLSRPLCYLGGHYVSEEEKGNHAFVCDGYDENNLFHFNWGWGGSSDGYYAIGALDLGSGISQQYNQYNAFFCNCFPCTPSINPPSEISTTVNGHDVSVQWSNVNGASSYKLYRDGDLVANNLTSTNCTDSNLIYGTHSYYVKSVAAEGTMSLSSDISIANVSFSGPAPTNLQATVNNHNVNLSWTAPASDTSVLSYGEGPFVSHCGYGGNYNMYWAQRYPAQILSDNVAGMAINKISVYYSRMDNIVINAYIYKGDSQAPEELLFQTSKTLDNSGWQDIDVTTPVPIDYSNDLWIVLYADTTASSPAAYCNYTGPGREDALYISLNGTSYWKWNKDYSWMIKTYATDGAYTYNLYRNNAKIANEITATAYQDNNLPDDHYVYYVTTNYYSGESNPSNEVEVMIGNPQYTISASANPPRGGFVSGGGTYGYGQTCTLTATPRTNFIFLNWTENDNVVSTNAAYSFIAERNRDLTANFVPQNCVVSISSSGGGSVSGGGTYQYGQTCTLTAVPNAGYVFTDWIKDGETVSSNATFIFAVTESTTFMANFTKASSGVLNGLFSVGDSKQVRFSQGNLQYQASTDTWRFSDNQWDFVGAYNTNISSSYSGWIDLFGWGTSGYNHGATCYQPWSTSTENSDYFAYNNTIFNLYDETGLADWGANPIVNGGNTPNHWRTLKVEEWQYLFETRPGIRYAKAIVNDKCGVILLPDGWNESVYELNNPNEGEVPYTSNVIAADDWAIIESAGAVFLPATGVRHGNSVTHIGFYCGYWLSSRFERNNNCAYCVILYTDYVSHTFNYRNNGYAVRLVSDYSAVTQTTQLSRGWNWYSTYIEQEGIDGLGQLENSIGVPKAIIQSQGDGFAKSILRNGRILWGGALSSINNVEMYKIGTKYICEATMEGVATNPAEHPITINKGWNWIGFPCDQNVNLNVAMSDFNPKNNDVIKGIHSYATYRNGTWSGTLNTLEPGQGYMYGSRSNATKTLVFQTSSRGEATLANITSENNYYQPADVYADNMTVIAVVDLDGEELRSEDYELAAFVGDECRGSVKLMYVKPIDRYVAFLTVFGEQEEELRFQLTDGFASSLSSDRLVYSIDDIAGSLEEPVVLRFGTTDVDENMTANVRIYPNPSEGIFNIEGNNIRKVEVFNALGQPVYSKDTENGLMQIDLTIRAAGIYLIRIVTDDGIWNNQVMKR